jgi:hypothetical protein
MPGPVWLAQFPLAANMAAKFFRIAMTEAIPYCIDAAASRGCGKIPYALRAGNLLSRRREIFQRRQGFSKLGQGIDDGNDLDVLLGAQASRPLFCRKKQTRWPWARDTPHNDSPLLRLSKQTVTNGVCSDGKTKAFRNVEPTVCPNAEASRHQDRACRVRLSALQQHL